MNIDDAVSILPWVSVIERDATGKPVKLSVPCKAERPRRGAPRSAVVVLSRTPATDKAPASVVCDCRIVGTGDASEPEQCKGMASGAVCYHALAALLACADEQGGTLAIPALPGLPSFKVKAGYSIGTTTASYAKRGSKPPPADPAPASCPHPTPPGVACEFCTPLAPLPVALPSVPAKRKRSK